MNLSPVPVQKFFDNNGRPLAGGLLFTYVSGTSMKIATYTNSAGTLNTNPIVLDFRGECRLWIDPTLSYTFVLSPANDTDPPTAPIWTVDDITAGPAQQDNAADDTGSVNNIELSIPQISSPVAFTRIVFKAANTNTGPVTISINGGTAKNLTWQNTGALGGSEVLAGGIYEAIYDGAQWQLQGPTLSPPELRTPAEISAGIVPVSYGYPPGAVERYGSNIVPGTTDMSAALAAASAQAVVAGGAPITVHSLLHIQSSTTITGPFIAAPAAQLFTPTSVVVFASGSVNAVFPDWWGTGNNTLALARTAVFQKYIPVLLLAREYVITSTLAITDDGAAIIGANQSRDTEGGTFNGSVISYTPTSGTAILVGQAPGVDGNFLSKLTLAGFTLHVTENTDIALRCWHLAGRSKVQDLTIRGNSDNDGSNNIGLQMDGCIDTEVARCIVFGQGASGSGVTTLENGYFVQNGFGGSPTTTLRFIECYVSQCRFGWNITSDSYVDMIACVYESCHNAGMILLDAKVNLFSPWFENNATSGNGALRAQGAQSMITISGGRIDVGANQDFIQLEGDNKLTLLGGTTFASSNGSPQVVQTGGNNPSVAVLGENVYATNSVIWDAATATANKSLIYWRSGRLVVGAAPVEASAVIDFQSTTKGFAPPRMTTAERDAIASPGRGIIIFNTSTDKLQVRITGAWADCN